MIVLLLSSGAVVCPQPKDVLKAIIPGQFGIAAVAVSSEWRFRAPLDHLFTNLHGDCLEYVSEPVTRTAVVK